MKKEVEFIELVEGEKIKFCKSFYEKLLKKIKEELSLSEKLALSVTFCNNNYIQELNKNYRGKDVPTDVLSFALEDVENKKILEQLNKNLKVREIGDIVISYEKAVEQSKEYNNSLERELCFLFTHGVLHLLGYDHMNVDDEKIMFDLQKKILDSFEVCRWE